MENDSIYAIWLSLKQKPTENLCGRLMKIFADTRSVYAAEKESLVATGILSDSEAEALSDKDLSDAEKIMYSCFDSDISIITYDSQKYPKSLRASENPPAVLYCKGNFPDFNGRLVISVVGPREMSPYGATVCAEITSSLSAAGAIILSGLALGIDAVASAAAIAVGGTTAAIMACGVDVVYPKTHSKLRERIIGSKGAIISEYPPNTQIDRLNFRERNRFFPAMADATLVIEGTISGGTAITAEYALASGKPVYTVPSDITEPNHELPLELIRKGAIPIDSAYDILTDFEKEYYSVVNLAMIENKKKVSVAGLFSEYGIGMKLNSEIFNDAFPSVKRNKKKNWLQNVFSKNNNKKQSTEDYDDVININIANKQERASDCTTSEESVLKKIKAIGPTALKIYKKVSKTPMLPEELADNTVSVSDMMTSLTLLEISGYIETLPDGKIARKL
ncbi:MAG: DNA-processing protein DprA [Eubacteriales bacterium]|nr:DNA-processing protein DprA [Eubacteriales bacterium]